jgi:L-ribulose-5-phosphate 4-epimerase
MPAPLAALKEQVLVATRGLPMSGLVTQTWGNVSGIDRGAGAVVIKPSGVPFEELTTESLVVLSLDGEQMEGHLRPSSDAPTHLELYRGFPDVGGIVHTHSPWATAWAQAERPIPALGTTHADYFEGEIPCTRALTPAECGDDYEAATGRVIVEAFRDRDPLRRPGVLVRRHGPFAWGRDVPAACERAEVLEQVAELAVQTLLLAPHAGAMDGALLDRHFTRKHGPRAYYGQPGSRATRSR